MSDANAKGATKPDIRQRLTALTREDRAMRTAALRAVSEKTNPMFKALQSDCAQTGHEWKFSEWNITRTYAWDKCVWCGAAEGADKHAGAANV